MPSDVNKQHSIVVYVQVNKLGMPLYTLAIVGRHGCGQPVVQALLYREDQAHIVTFLQSVQKLCQNNTAIDITSSVFLVDKDSAEIGALNAVFPGQSVLLCRFHVVRAMTEEIKKLSLTNMDKEMLVSVTNVKFINSMHLFYSLLTFSVVCSIICSRCSTFMQRRTMMALH